MQSKNTFTYDSFLEYTKELLADNKATGTDHSPAKIEASKINAQRFKRLNKTAKINAELKQIIEDNQPEWEWTVIAEGWCGDAAQILPYINKIVTHSESISLQIILRDENEQIMDRYLTNQARAIPILVCHNTVTKKEVGHWGPRPSKIIDWIATYKSENPNYTPEQFKKDLHTLYTINKGEIINEALLNSIKTWIKTD